jgi:hypothetical protein
MSKVELYTLSNKDESYLFEKKNTLKIIHSGSESPPQFLKVTFEKEDYKSISLGVSKRCEELMQALKLVELEPIEN